MSSQSDVCNENSGVSHLRVPKMRTGRRSSDVTDIYEWLRRRSPSPNKLLVLPGLGDVHKLLRK